MPDNLPAVSRGHLSPPVPAQRETAAPPVPAASPSTPPPQPDGVLKWFLGSNTPPPPPTPPGVPPSLSGDDTPQPLPHTNLPSPVGAAPAVSSAGGVIGAISDTVRYSGVLTKLALAAIALHRAGNRVRDTYSYITDCAQSVDNQADLAANLRVDQDTLAEHRQAANIMRNALKLSDDLAAKTDDLALMFEQARADHARDYGPVVQVAQAMTVEMADRSFYRNR
ncbi:hypothetical protein ACFC1B_07165 [Streptomyces xiamenensis]|uniref:hypothetical protein n=1 Tax=Streptomyces xiamenensis TaxID=408015 RepID=UPI0035D974E9